MEWRSDDHPELDESEQSDPDPDPIVGQSAFADCDTGPPLGTASAFSPARAVSSIRGGAPSPPSSANAAAGWKPAPRIARRLSTPRTCVNRGMVPSPPY